MRLSGLNMTGRSSQGSLNEAHLNAAALAYRDKLGRQENQSEMLGGYISPASTASPGTSPLIRQIKESSPSALRSEGIYDFGSVGDFSPAFVLIPHPPKLSQVPENDEITTTRRGSIQPQEPLPHIYVQNHLEPQGSYPISPSEARASSVQPAIPQQHYSSGEMAFVPVSGSAQPDSSYQQSNQLQYSPESNFQGAPNSMGMPHTNMSRYVPPTSEYTYAASHAQEPFASFS